jgi:Cys-rich protein (TIGR01571 family)
MPAPGMGFQEQSKPLLGDVEQGEPAVDNPVFGPVSPQRQWQGECYHCCGSPCDAAGCGTCCLVWWCPCVAFGSSSKLSLGLSAFAQTLLYVVFFYGVSWVSNSTIGATCPDPALYADSSCPSWVHPWASIAIGVAVTLLASLWAACRRRQIRERLGIPGSFLRDYCCWVCCTTCTQCQETRTVQYYCGRSAANPLGGLVEQPVTFVTAPLPAQM